MIAARDLTKHFQNVTAINGLNCNIPDGCIYGLVGVNGAGKSTLLRLMSGIYRPDGGSICVDGGNIFEHPEAKAKVALVPDELFFLSGSNLFDMADLYAAAYRHFDRKRFAELMGQFRLDGKKPLAAFSKGQRRQAATILALSAGTNYILFDETFDGLDPVMRNLVKNVLYSDVTDRGITAVVTSHSLRELEDTCDQLSLLYEGTLVYEGDAENLRTSLFKMQVAFRDTFDQSKFSELDLVHFEKSGSVASIIVRGDQKRACKLVQDMQPVLMEQLPMTLEEVFLYEMETMGYAFPMETAKGGDDK